MKNERTSKRVASKAARLPRRLEKLVVKLYNLADELGEIRDEADSVSMSALTQAPDRKPRVRR